MILAGRVRVGSRPVRDPSLRVDPQRDAIWLDGKRVRSAARASWLLHKPAGYVTTRRDPEGRPTVYDLLPADLPLMMPVGRLDRDSSGLLLLTNDTQLGAFLTDPRTHVPKGYEVRLDAPITASEAARLAAGVVVLGRKTRPAQVALRSAEPCADVEITLFEGRNRQVRRMFETLGLTVVRLRRVRIGPLWITGLKVGEARPLRSDERRALDRLRGERA